MDRITGLTSLDQPVDVHNLRFETETKNFSDIQRATVQYIRLVYCADEIDLIFFV